MVKSILYEGTIALRGDQSVSGGYQSVQPVEIQGRADSGAWPNEQCTRRVHTGATWRIRLNAERSVRARQRCGPTSNYSEHSSFCLWTLHISFSLDCCYRQRRRRARESRCAVALPVTLPRIFTTLPPLLSPTSSSLKYSLSSQQTSAIFVANSFRHQLLHCVAILLLGPMRPPPPKKIAGARTSAPRCRKHRTLVITLLWTAGRHIKNP